MELSFTGVLLKVSSVLVKIDLLVFEVHSLLESFSFYVRVDVMEMKKIVCQPDSNFQ